MNDIATLKDWRLVGGSFARLTMDSATALMTSRTTEGLDAIPSPSPVPSPVTVPDDATLPPGNELPGRSASAPAGLPSARIASAESDAGAGVGVGGGSACTDGEGTPVGGQSRRGSSNVVSASSSGSDAANDTDYDNDDDVLFTQVRAILRFSLCVFLFTPFPPFPCFLPRWFSLLSCASLHTHAPTHTHARAHNQRLRLRIHLRVFDST
jgi:hypothetical protein